MSVDPQTQSLFEAIAATNYAQVKRILDSGVSVNSHNDRGQTPLTVACKQGNLEIVNLLLASGGQIQVPAQAERGQALRDHRLVDTVATAEKKSPVVPVLGDWDFQSILFETDIPTTELSESPVRDRQIVYEDLIELMHQAPAQESAENDLVRSSSVDRAVEQLTESASTPVASAPTTGQKINLIVSGWHEASSDPEATYTFDLDEVFAANEQKSAPPVDRLTMRIDELQEGETYAIDEMPDFGSLGLEPTNPDPADLPIDSMNWEEGETYAIDLGDLDSFNRSATAIDPRIVSVEHLDVKLLPVIGGEDRTDTQTRTEIFSYSQTPTAAKPDDLNPIYDENATNTSLMAAIVAGDLDLASQAVEAQASLDRYDWQLGFSPLGMAISRGHVDLVRFLLDVGANPRTGSLTMTALGLAAEQGEAEIIQMILPRGIDVNEPVGQDGWTALLSAIEHGHRSVVQLLVAAGANVNIWSRGETPILLAAKCEEREIYNYLYPLLGTELRLCADRDGEQFLQTTRQRRLREQNRSVEKFIEVATAGNIYEVNRAIELGIEIDAIGACGHNALMAAAHYGHRATIAILLAAGANLHLLSDGDRGLGLGMTALMFAANSFFARDRHLVVKQLVAGGADVNQQGAGGKTAIMYAALAGAGYRTCVKTLISASADLDLPDDHGHTVLSLVAAAENYQMFNLLLQAGASTKGLESIQLIQAATSGNFDRVQSLLSARVNLDLDRGAAICNAAAAGHTQVVDLLIRAGANVNLSNKSGFTPIACAAHAGYLEIVRLLIAAGADIQALPGSVNSYSAIEYAQMGMYQFVGATQTADRNDRQHAEIVRILEQLLFLPL